MANEIQLDTRMQVSNGSLKFTFAPGTVNIDQSVDGGPTPGYQTIGTSEESEALSELATEGMCILVNLDDTNYVEWGFSTGVYGGRLKPGEHAVLRLNTSTTLYLRANTAACRVQIMAFED